jgi:hypothetical protein
MAFRRSGVRSPLSPPDYLPSIDKMNFIGGWFYFCPETLMLADFRGLGFFFFQLMMLTTGNFTGK